MDCVQQICLKLFQAVSLSQGEISWMTLNTCNTFDIIWPSSQRLMIYCVANVWTDFWAKTRQLQKVCPTVCLKNSKRHLPVITIPYWKRFKNSFHVSVCLNLSRTAKVLEVLCKARETTSAAFIMQIISEFDKPVSEYPVVNRNKMHPLRGHS